jgi:hypothetical protein
MGIMIDEQKCALYMYAGLLTGFIFGFWRGLSLLQQKMEVLHTAELHRFSSTLTGMLPLGQACFFAIVGGWLFAAVYENNAEKVNIVH